MYAAAIAPPFIVTARDKRDRFESDEVVSQYVACSRTLSLYRTCRRVVFGHRRLAIIPEFWQSAAGSIVVESRFFKRAGEKAQAKDVARRGAVFCPTPFAPNPCGVSPWSLLLWRRPTYSRAVSSMRPGFVARPTALSNIFLFTRFAHLRTASSTTWSTTTARFRIARRAAFFKAIWSAFAR